MFLVGFMGAGKTSVGRALAQRLGWSFQDLDELIENRHKKSVAQIFAEAGEAAFRQMEAAALRELLQASADTGAGSVVALGGGAFVQKENREAIARSGSPVVLLEAPVEEMRRRCTAQGAMRPLAGDAERFARLYSARRAAYELAPLRVQNVNKTVDQAAAEIENLIAAAVGRRQK
ncbi:MAG TPA: shikimate kinase [Candidatus Angelobacter sp.]|nr:shikimate kinase [Candidatus Angelobacter sp.]